MCCPEVPARACCPSDGGGPPCCPSALSRVLLNPLPACLQASPGLQFSLLSDLLLFPFGQAEPLPLI